MPARKQSRAPRTEETGAMTRLGCLQGVPGRKQISRCGMLILYNQGAVLPGPGNLMARKRMRFPG
jgi:hypothetical protein